MGWTHKATVAQETAAALAGGYWAVLDMPNTPPNTVDTTRLREKREHVATRARCEVGLYLGADGSADGSAYADAAPAAVGLKLYCDHTTGSLLVDDQATRRRHLRAWGAASDKPVAVHAEGETLAAVLSLVREEGVRVHFCHVSQATEIGLLREAKADGVPVSIGVTPHHLYLEEADARRLAGFGRVKPPLRTSGDREALWAAVLDRTVDVVESDHAPHTREEKASADPPYGLPGLETTVPLLVTAMRERGLPEERVIELLATNAQRLFGLVPPPGTFTLVDPSASYVISDDGLQTTPGWSPFSGMRVWGRVVEVRIRGRVAFDGEAVLAQPGEGRVLPS
jgi:carbamoyl-phosphate synthase/aspartate carbamoyltransferase/dihydroorotase